MALKNFGLIVIGTGVSGVTVASTCRAAGWKVAVVDSQPFGGTCPLRGCDPKKVLVSAAELVDWSRRTKGRGVSGSTVIDWPGLMRFKRTFTDPVPAAREKGFAEEGIEAFHSRVRFLDQSTLAAGEDMLKTRHVAIAAGAKPVALNIPGEELLTTSTQFLRWGIISWQSESYVWALKGSEERDYASESRPSPKLLAYVRPIMDDCQGATMG